MRRLFEEERSPLHNDTKCAPTIRGLLEAPDRSLRRTGNDRGRYGLRGGLGIPQG